MGRFLVAHALRRDQPLIGADGRATWVDERRFACAVNDGTIVSLEVDTGHKRKIDLPWVASQIILAGDGEHWIATRSVVRLTRHAIANFAERPWAR